MTNKTKDTFHIGLCMAGAVSAGAYTAGVLDYLLEALDLWEKKKKSGEEHIPTHKVVIPVIGGASAGGMTGIILASTVNNPMHPIRRLTGNLMAEQPQNKLYHAWVDLTQEDMFAAMLSNDDIDRSKTVTSLLNSNFIDQIARNLLNVDASQWIYTNYVSEHLKTFVTLSNLKGFEFNVNFKDNSCQLSPYYITRHNDFACFVLNKDHDQYQDDGWMPLNFRNGCNVDVARDAAMATGAFPLGLRARKITRDGKYLNDLKWLMDVTRLNPMPDGEYQSLFVDGGLIDNEPFDKVRDCLTEITGQKQDEYESYDTFESTVVMIDPFPSKPGYFTDSDQVGNIASSTFSTMMEQLRNKPASLVDAMDADNAGQFLISPRRRLTLNNETKELQGSKAIACGTLGGFGGFLDKEFRIHDFFLGRANCEKFLRDYFTFPADTPNAIFKNGYRDIPEGMYTSGIDGKRQIIPLFTEPTKQPYLPIFSSGTNWPVKSHRAIERFHPMLKRRIQKLALHLGELTLFKRILIWMMCRLFLNEFVAGKVTKGIKSSLKDAALIKS